ncbi:MAG: outer membrane protein assembly factor BamB family protein [Planctomycetota bacterium]|jgi:outer membrane protein assembly factor BamB
MGTDTVRATRQLLACGIACAVALGGCGGRKPTPAPKTASGPATVERAPDERAEPVEQAHATAAQPVDETAGRPAAGPASEPAASAPKAEPELHDWPCWRGPTHDNVAPGEQEPPTEWSASRNVVWRVRVPGQGHGSPCIVGDRIILGTGDRKAGTVSMLCLDRSTGAQRWKTDVYQGRLAKVHRDNSPASATCAWDGERAFLSYQTDREIRLAALDGEGNKVWDKALTSYGSMHGFGASPIVYKSLVIVATDGQPKPGASRMVAVDRKTGETVWRIPSVLHSSYASGLVIKVAGRDQLVVLGPEKTWSFDPASGRPLWNCKGPASYCAATAAFSDDTVFVTGGYPKRSLLAIRADGSGDVASTHVRWKGDKKVGYVPSPLYAGGLLYAVADKGLMRCYDAASGEILWSHDFKAPFYSSPVLVGDKLYVFDRKGKGYVMRAGRESELIATNALPHGAAATPVILDGRIYLRSYEDFYCLGSN